MVAHVSVLMDEVLAYLAPEPGKSYVDATLGAGGHSGAILERLQGEGKLIGIDQDASALALARGVLGEPANLVFLQGNFSDLKNLLRQAGIEHITGGILADIGVSSMQLDQGERGFSFSKNAPLDMRMSRKNPLTASEVVNTYAEADLVRIFSEYGEEHLSKTIAREIVHRRKAQPITTTQELADLIRNLYHQRGKKNEKIHPATRVFQALRIEVNDELGSLQRFLEQLPDVLAPGARAVIISFHSLEDRIIKQYFQTQSRDCICPPRLPICQCNHQAAFKILTSKPISATEEEIRQNPRARSAKLRAAERLPL